MLQIYQKKDIFLWLVSSSILLILLIWVGGLTRLTGSGLSITEWEVFSGILPPFGDQQWNNYFSFLSLRKLSYKKKCVNRSFCTN